jgi:1-acyl-sn-glycerol-3-phosphate acyltransferase
MIDGLRILFFVVLVQPILLVILGLRIRYRERLPANGPAILAANHNSHLDTLVLMNLFPLRMLSSLRPVAAADYFLRHKWLAWFVTHIMHILPLERHVRPGQGDPLEGVTRALEHGDIAILFPEGSRGEPERLSRFKTGIAHLAKRLPQVPVVPIFLHGFGKSLPRGEAILVPFYCDIFIGEPIFWNGDREKFMQELEGSILALAEEGHFPPWE